MSVCFCTLAIKEPYRRRARLLCADSLMVPWVVLTDEPDDFADLPIRAIRHTPTGPLAVDYVPRPLPTGGGRARLAYHDKRFALRAALEDFDTAVLIDADSRFTTVPRLGVFPPGIAVTPFVQASVAEHLEKWGTWRKPFFGELARHLTGDTGVLQTARWCHEALLSITKDGRESRFFEAWDIAADFLQSREVYSGEGGVIGLAAACAGWSVDYESLTDLAAQIQNEGLG